MKGDRLASLAELATAAAFTQVTVTRYGKTETIAAHAFTCWWYYVTGPQPVTVILIRDKKKTGYDLALITTQQNPDIVQVIERYAARWAIGVAIEDAKQLFGTGQARNRTARAVGRTLPFMLTCQAVAVCWYATAGHHPADTQARRRNAPWYTAKTEPSTADMTAKLRRIIIAAKFKRTSPDQPEPEEIHAIRLAWEDAECRRQHLLHLGSLPDRVADLSCPGGDRLVHRGGRLGRADRHLLRLGRGGPDAVHHQRSRPVLPGTGAGPSLLKVDLGVDGYHLPVPEDG